VKVLVVPIIKTIQYSVGDYLLKALPQVQLYAFIEVDTIRAVPQFPAVVVRF
jgi:hypothetical protein